jgi:hypothetical protein
MTKQVSTAAVPGCADSAVTVRPVAPSLTVLASAMAIWALALAISVIATLTTGNTPAPRVVPPLADIATRWAVRPHVGVLCATPRPTLAG